MKKCAKIQTAYMVKKSRQPKKLRKYFHCYIIIENSIVILIKTNASGKERGETLVGNWVFILNKIITPHIM